MPYVYARTKRRYASWRVTVQLAGSARDIAALVPHVSGRIVDPRDIGSGERQHIEEVTVLLVSVSDSVRDC